MIEVNQGNRRFTLHWEGGTNGEVGTEHIVINEPQTFRATGIMNFLENGGTLEVAQRIAGHADSRTTKLYDRRGQKVLVEDMERIRY